MHPKNTVALIFKCKQNDEPGKYLETKWSAIDFPFRRSIYIDYCWKTM